jgi:4-nitrophenyl phosphatase
MDEGLMDKPAETLARKKLFILDMDGTFYLGNRVLDGSMQFIQKVRQMDRDFVFFTNNASRTSEFYVKKLAAMGCAVEPSDIITSGDVTIRYLREHHRDGRVYLVGTPELEGSFAAAGVDLVADAPDIVVVSFDLTLTYEKVSRACTFIRQGAIFMATHMDLNCPTEEGFIPDCGSICAMVTASTGVRPRYFGKPFRETVDMIGRLTGYRPEEMVIIGDRLYTDIATGRNNGVTSILILSGETKQEDLEKSDIKPDFVFADLGSLAASL